MKNNYLMNNSNSLARIKEFHKGILFRDNQPHSPQVKDKSIQIYRLRKEAIN